MKFQSNFEPAPVGSHIAQLVGLVDLGTHEAEWGPNRQLWFSFILLNETMENGGPFTVSRFVSKKYSQNAALRKILDALIGRPLTKAEKANGYDVRRLLGTVCVVQIVHVEKEAGAIYANLESVSALPKGVTAPKIPDAEEYFLDLEPEGFDEADYLNLPSWLQDKVRGSPEYGELTGAGSDKPRREPLKAAAADEPDDDEPPFDADDGETPLSTKAEPVAHWKKGRAPRVKLGR
jgi:hypothetical protein